MHGGRLAEMREAAATVRKACVEAARLSPPASPLQLNQLVRWIATKDSHADAIVALVLDRLSGDPIAAPHEYAAHVSAQHRLLLAAVASAAAAPPPHRRHPAAAAAAAR